MTSAVRQGGEGSRPIPIMTFVNDDDSYAEMRHSFQAAGFTSGRASFIRLDSAGRLAVRDPYAAISEFIGSCEEPSFILCHQDIRADQGHGWSDFISAMDSLARIDPSWAVAGNAGGSSTLRMVRRITDPHGGSTDDALPALVQTLDENFLVIRTGTGVSCSPELWGFHLYGSDICLNARRAGLGCYVVDFHVRHLSGGTKDDRYYECRDRFVAVWGDRYAARYVRAPMEVLFLSRSSIARAVLGGSTVRRILKNHPSLGQLAGRALARN
jgi:hypothetical protein